MKYNQPRQGFELVSPCPFPATITITPRAPKLHHYCSFTIRLFSVISRTFVRVVLPLCRIPVGVFYNPSQLDLYVYIITLRDHKYVIFRKVQNDSVVSNTKNIFLITAFHTAVNHRNIRERQNKRYTVLYKNVITLIRERRAFKTPTSISSSNQPSPWRLESLNFQLPPTLNSELDCPQTKLNESAFIISLDYSIH